MIKLSFRGIRIERGKYAKEPVERKHINILVTFREKRTKEEFYWYPTYRELGCLIHCLAALHGEEEVTSGVLNDNGLIKIYNKQIERVINEVPNS